MWIWILDFGLQWIKKQNDNEKLKEKKVENENPKLKFSNLNLLHKACTRTKQKINSREGCGNWKFLIKV